MFVMDAAPTFETTVRLDLAGGRVDHVRVTFNYVVGDDYAALLAETRDAPAAVFMHRLIADWATQDDPEKRWAGMPEPYSLAALEKLFKKFPRASRGLMAAYNHEVLGLPLGN